MESGPVGAERGRARLGIRLILVTLIALTAASAALDASASAGGTKAPPAALAVAPAITPEAGLAPATPAPPGPRDAGALAVAVAAVEAAGGATVGVSLVELAGILPLSWSSNGTAVFSAASTYKLAVLMIEARRIAAGTTIQMDLSTSRRPTMRTGSSTTTAPAPGSPATSWRTALPISRTTRPVTCWSATSAARWL